MHRENKEDRPADGRGDAVSVDRLRHAQEAPAALTAHPY